MVKTKALEETMELAQGAYSFGRYANWEGVAKKLLKVGYTPHQAAAIMLSKWTRWAADIHPAKYGKTPASAIIDYIVRYPNETGIDEVNKMTRETFPGVKV